jgi:cell division protein FtsA
VARDPYLVAIDIGSSTIKLAVAKDSLDENDKVQILALIERPSSGIKRGIVTNMSEATESLIEIVNQAESIIGLPIKRCVAGLSGMGVAFTNSDGLIIISGNDNEISDSDVDRVIQDSLTKAFGLNNNEIIHVIPRNFSVDNQTGIRYPVGMVGSKLEAKTLIVSVETSYLRNFTKVFNQASLDITNQIFTPLASGDFLLSVRQKKAGTVLVDIGYSSTTFIVWENEEIIGSGAIPIGSDHITADLAVGLQTTMEMAEEIKKQHLDLGYGADTEIDEVEMYNPDLQINEIFKIPEMRQFARARAEEIFIFLHKELKKLGKNGQLPGGVVMIGGGSALPGIDDVAKDVLRLPIFKYSFDRNEIDFVPDYNGDPAFTNVISLAAYSLFHSEDAQFNKQYSKNNLSLSRANLSGDGAGGVGGLIKNLWPFS